MNTAALTGESLPREVGPGDEVLSGFINTSGLLHVETTCEFDESTASKILDLVENASSRKSRSEQFITKFAKVYTPAVCYSALALAVLPPVVRTLMERCRSGGHGSTGRLHSWSSAVPAPLWSAFRSAFSEAWAVPAARAS